MEKRRSGFTLIELLVVIAVIGILSAIGLIAMQGARERARDSKRKTDLGSVRTALALYYDAFGNFPPQASALPFNNTSTTGNVLYDALIGEPKFMGQLPDAPSANEWYYYLACDDSEGRPNGNYTLYAFLERPVNPGSWWVLSYSKSTADEAAVTACPQP